MSSLLARTRSEVDWFHVVADAIDGNPQGAGLPEVRSHFESLGATIGGVAYDPKEAAQVDALTASLQSTLASLEGMRLISGRDTVRRTKNLGLRAPIRVGQLTRRGNWLRHQSRGIQQAYFFAQIAMRGVRGWFDPFKTIVAVILAGIGVWRIYEFWGALPATIAIAVATLVAAIIAMTR